MSTQTMWVTITVMAHTDQDPKEAVTTLERAIDALPMVISVEVDDWDVVR